MKREEIRMLLIRKIPLEESAQKTILDEIPRAMAESRWEDLSAIVRCSFMGETDILRRKSYYLDLARQLAHSLVPGSPWAGGATGLYLGFIGEDLEKCRDTELREAGKALLAAHRLATNPPAFPLPGFDRLQMGPLPLSPADAAKNPRQLVLELLAHPELFADPASHALRDLLIGGDVTPEGLFSQAQALVRLGVCFEAVPLKPWALACYHAAAVIGPHCELPWAFLAGAAETPEQGMKYAQKALQVNPRSLPGLQHRGTQLARLGQHDEALRDFAEICRFDRQSPRSVLLCAQAALDAGKGLLAARLYFHAAKSFPQLAEPWHGLARLCLIAGHLEASRRYQHRCFRLSHGNVAARLRLGGRLFVRAHEKGIPVLLDGKPIGRTPLDIPELPPGEHRITWEGGPGSKVMTDEGEGHSLFWTGNGNEIICTAWEIVPAQFPESIPPGHRDLFVRRKDLVEFLGPDHTKIPDISDLAQILEEVGPPSSPFGGENRLTVEFVVAALLEEILADGVLEQAENEALRAVQDRLLIEASLLENLLSHARKISRCTPSGRTPSGKPFDAGSLYARIWKKAQEDGTIEDSERLLLQAVGEALGMSSREMAAIEQAVQ